MPAQSADNVLQPWEQSKISLKTPVAVEDQPQIFHPELHLDVDLTHPGQGEWRLLPGQCTASLIKCHLQLYSLNPFNYVPSNVLRIVSNAKPRNRRSPKSS